MIIDVNEVKALLQIPDNSYDTFISNIIPMVQDFVIKYTNNSFEVRNGFYRLETNLISFEAGTPAKIITEQAQFLNMKLSGGIHIKIFGSRFNDGIYKIASVENNVITLSNEDSLINEGNDRDIVVSVTIIQFPKGIKLPVAKLIGYHLDKKNLRGVSSESLGDYSVSYHTGGSYPKALLDELNQYRLLDSVKYSLPYRYDIRTKR